MTALRKELSLITESVRIQDHPASVEALVSKYGHSIVAIQSEYPIDRYTCVVHAFYLIEDPTYVDIASSGLGRTFAGPEFVNFLLQKNLLVPRQSPFPGDLIVYFDDKHFRHVGRMKAETRVLSKWGTGCLYEHGVWEVPSSYGEKIQYFVGTNEEESFGLFIQYAESKGFQFTEP